MTGWLKLHRKLLDSNMYKSLNSKQRDVLFSCLMLTNHAENEWEFNKQIFKCKPGQFVTSLDSIAKNCGSDVKVQSVRTALLKLEKWGFLTNESTKTGRLITICKWDTYQQEEKQANKATNRKPTKSQQRANKDLTTNKNVKNDNNEKNEKELIYRAFAHLSISKEENQKLIELGYRQNEIDNIYDSIENFKKNINYNSLYLTSRKWLKREFPDRQIAEAGKEKLYTYRLQDAGTKRNQPEKQYLIDKNRYESNGWKIELINTK